MNETESTIKTAEVTAKILAPLLGAPSELSFKEASQRFFHGRPLRWVKQYITTKSPEVTEGPEAWMTRPRGTGHPVRIIDPIKASVWMLKHGKEIDWDADFPETVELRKLAATLDHDLSNTPTTKSTGTTHFIEHLDENGGHQPFQDYPMNANGRRPYHMVRTGKNKTADIKTTGKNVDGRN